MKKNYSYLIILSLFLTGYLNAQDCSSTVNMKLNNISNGGHFANQTVELTSTSSHKVYTETSNAKGEVSFSLPCDERFDVKISNYASKDEIKSPGRANSMSTRNYSYEADMIQKRIAFAMDDTQKSIVDQAIAALPDTTFVRGGAMQPPRGIDNYTKLDITLIGLESQYLVNEEIVFTGRKRNKSFKAKTNTMGHVRVYLPKGDIYSVNFQYHNDYRLEEIEYSKGTGQVRIEIMYMGTKEYLRRKKEDEKRKIEEKRRAAAALAGGGREYREDKVLEVVMDRNEWNNKLLISDVSSEMLGYAMKLADWYNVNRKGGQTTQFVLYYNGQMKSGSKSGAAFHLASPEYDTLIGLINYVHGNSALSNAKYSLEDLIVGNGLEKTYDDVILFVDKDAHLADFETFKQIKVPMHVVLCVDPRRPNPQHLTLAWKTKGSIHTLSGDYPNIGKLVEGDTFQLEGYKYKIMGGEFVQIAN